MFQSDQLNKMLENGYLRAPRQIAVVCDLVFLDPPYHFDNYYQLTSFILDNKLLSKNGIIVIESQSNLTFDSKIWNKTRHYKYGDINVDIIWRQI